MDTSTANGTTPSATSQTNSGGGVVDYFAILGIGDDLVLKSTQKKNQRVSDGDNKDDISKRRSSIIAEEEEFSMVERFYREIVEVAIFTVYSDSDGKDFGGTLATSFMESNNDTRVSIIKSDEGAGCDLPSEISGFKILHKTAAVGKYPTNATSASSNHEVDHSFITDKDISFNTTVDTLSGEVPNIMLYSKAQTYDANLHPKGLRDAILSSAWNEKTNANGNPTINLDVGCQPVSKQEREQQGRLGNLVGGRVGKLRHRLSPILSNPIPLVLEKCKESSSSDMPSIQKRFYIAHRRRGADENERPAIADLVIRYCRVHRLTIISQYSNDKVSSGRGTLAGVSDTDLTLPIRNHKKRFNAENAQKGAMALRRGIVKGVGIATRAAANRTSRIIGSRMNHSLEDHPLESLDKEEMHENDSPESINNYILNLHEVLPLPGGFDEWIIPDMYQTLKLPPPTTNISSSQRLSGNGGGSDDIETDDENKMAERRMRRTFLFKHQNSPTALETGVGIEAFVDGNTFLLPSPPSKSVTGSPDKRNPWSPVEEPPLDFASSSPNSPKNDPRYKSKENNEVKEDVFAPFLIPCDSLPDIHYTGKSNDAYEYFPVIAVRRVRVGDEERYREDPGVVDIEVTFSKLDGNPVIPIEEEVDDDENSDIEDIILNKSSWSVSRVAHVFSRSDELQDDAKPYTALGLPMILLRHNLPLGFADTSFATTVLDRFPKKDYKGVPLPEEELPMFCYPTGCRLSRQMYHDSPSAECYGFVVKNERGDSIHVSCVSFMEPLTTFKKEQLCRMSKERRKTSLPHNLFCVERRNIDNSTNENLNEANKNGNTQEYSSNSILTGFDQMMTYENKTICLVSRYPFWSAFRRFLTHLHILSGSTSTLPLERFISHLLLTVPVPKPGGQCILVPLPAIAAPMAMWLPPAKDLPLLDLPFKRLFSCLDVPTVVTIMLGFLALERKVIIMSSYPSLVTDVCELLRALLFPFELCAPYVPRLTQPFMSCLDFPGAIFAGIHDDGCEDGLAAKVRSAIPEDTAIVDLDSGDIDCSGNRYEVLKECWEIIPHRSLFISEIETLCRNAGIVPGHEPVGIEIEAAFTSSIVPHLGDDEFDDRALRDCFLRFFCSIFGGYEKFLIVPDPDFLISGNEWFDTEGFLATTTGDIAKFLASFVTTQHFQSFIQRRTEASDVHCLLFDECLAEFHSSKVPFGTLEGDDKAKNLGDNTSLRYNLLIDECAADVYDGTELDDLTVEKSVLTTASEDGFMVNNSGDLVTAPSCKHLKVGSKYVYCVDGSPCFPQRLDPEMFYPAERNVFFEAPVCKVKVLTRSDRELDVSKLRRKLAVSHRGIQRQRRCLFQLPKFMGSHFLNTYAMCLPQQVSNVDVSLDLQARYLLRALGALRLLRSRHRIVLDEAGYRCLIVACGRAGSDRRVEIVKLFGLLRSDGIFPSAVTLGQYTRAIAEGFSKRSSGISESSTVNSSVIDTTASTTTKDKEFPRPLGNKDLISMFNLDGNIVDLEESGRRWRHKREKGRKVDREIEQNADEEHTLVSGAQHAPPSHQSTKKMHKKKQHKVWQPVLCSSSFSPHLNAAKFRGPEFVTSFKFVALWSRTTTCEKCFHVILDEEIQAGWDEGGEEDDTFDEIKCPCCTFTLHPTIGYNEMKIDSETGKLVNIPSIISNNERKGFDSSLQHAKKATFEDLPPQIRATFLESDINDGISGLVPYLSPSKMRIILETYIEENGEEILDRERLRNLDPTIFFNLWWYCARFSLPLPLSISTAASSFGDNIIAFAAWDKSVAVKGCHSGAKAVLNFQASLKRSSPRMLGSQVKHLIQPFNKFTVKETKHNSGGTSQQAKATEAPNGEKNDFPLLSHLTLQSVTQLDWDNADLSSILVTLVQACDKRDFYPAVTRVLQCNAERRARYGGLSGVELDCYQTLLYLTRYHCTSAFHKFFPSTCKPCKGYHFWCPLQVCPIFDRMFRDAVGRVRAQGNVTPIENVSDVALGFRSIFGHII